MELRATLAILVLAGSITGPGPVHAAEGPRPVRAMLATPGNQAADASIAATLYRHQDCIDEVAGVLGRRGHGTHVSASFISPAGTMILALDPINLNPATCLATSAAGLPPRNGYVGHFEFVLTDVHSTPVPGGEIRERFRCEYVGIPTIELGTFTCSGLQTFWSGRNHTITIIVEPSAPVLGIPVPSLGAIELTVSG